MMERSETASKVENIIIIERARVASFGRSEHSDNEDVRCIWSDFFEFFFFFSVVHFLNSVTLMTFGVLL